MHSIFEKVPQKFAGMNSFDYFCIRHSQVIGIAMLIRIPSLALFYGKGVYCVYSDALEIRDFQNEL